MNNCITFRTFLQTAFDNGAYTTDDVIHFVKPLFLEVLSFHEDGKAAPFEKPEALFITGDQLDVDEDFAHSPLKAANRLRALFDKTRGAHFNIVGSVRLHTDVDEGTSSEANLQIQLNEQEPITRPVYLPGYSCFEIAVGHHDDLTDLFCLGLVLGSMAMGLDLYDEEDLKTFVENRSNPAQNNTSIHPAISTLITEMTELDRARRTQDLYDVVQRLENYRDFDPEKQVDLANVAGWKTKEVSSKGQYILGKLRNRLFDTSRRNRLLYYKPNMRFVNLSVSSVPMVLHYQSIRPELLFTWNEEISGKVKDMKEIVLNKYLRFDDHQYLTASLDKIRTVAQHDIQEYGFSQLKLVIAFLNWHNLKEDKNERIQSPLLLIPVELKKNKKIREDHFVVKILDNEAEVNPIVANQLRELYGIKMPEFIDLDDTTVDAFYAKLKEQIDHANQGITLSFINKPRIKIIHSVAKQTVGNFKRRLRKGGTGLASYKDFEYSYQQEHFKPLGLEIFKRKIEPRASMLEFLVNEDINLSKQHLTGSKERELYELVDSENNPYSWDVDVCNIVLGNFNYKKMSLVRDYNQVIDKSIHHPVFEHFFSDQPRKFATDIQEDNSYHSWHHVITADPTQTKAIVQSRSGESYIIQGPPGTGKSQTITNLIADYVARGKNVLFVCEKRAALDVVYHRLKQQGLDELCCYIHDSQGDKRAFIKDLKNTYEDFIENNHDVNTIIEKRTRLIEKMGSHLQILTDYHNTNALRDDHAGMEVRKLVEKIIELKDDLVEINLQQDEWLPYYKEWAAFGETISKLGKALEETGADPWFAGHPFSSIKEYVFLKEAPVSFLQASIVEAKKWINELLKLYDEFEIKETSWRVYKQVREVIEDAVLLAPLAETGNIQLADPSESKANLFDKAYKACKLLQQQLKQAAEKNAGWSKKFTEQDVLNGLSIATENEQSFFSFFNGAWRRLKKQLNESYNFSAHQVRPSYSLILENLKNEYELVTQVTAANQALEQEYSLFNIDQVQVNIERIRAKKGDPEVEFLVHHPNANQLISRLHKANPSFWQLEACLKTILYDYETKTLLQVQDELDTIVENLDTLKDLLPSLKQYAEASAKVKNALRNLPLPAKTLQAAMANKTLHYICRYKKEFDACDGPAIESSVAQIGLLYAQLLRVNADYIRTQVRGRFVKHLELSNIALSQLNTEQRAFKKAYTEGRKILENEFGKSMRYKSIRELAGKESGLVLKDLKPVWLMSPLSVSDSLPINTQYFDVVIFDEASQITLEEGIPALFRAPQTIIVGDDKQMPPSNFFSAKAGDPDDLEHYNEDGDDLLSNDADSLLVQGSRKLNSVMLGWHYRSRYETLISYSNHAFYEASLLTIPDKTIHHTAKTPIEVAAVTDASSNVDALFNRSISFHFHPNSTYEKRVNTDEATYIAHLVRELLKRKIKESIGIVAFSQEQQHTIEDALTTLAAADKDFELLLEEAYTRTEDDQYVGLIIKNLENIQGDERDIIIMSVCYGPDARRKMIMNFGPINRKGGEKRLNVIFSRAKKHMAVISSIKHQAITNEYNEGANYLKRFLNYAEQVSAGNMTMARVILDSLVLKKETKEVAKHSIVLKQLKAALQKEGLQADENIGQSGFKCSLGIKKQADSIEYDLSILLDNELHYQSENILEQYVQRPGILKAFGWRIIQVFAKDWLQAPEGVIQQIKKRLAEEPKEPEEIIPDADATPEHLKPERVNVLAQQPAAGTAASIYDKLKFTRLEYIEGASSKFWEVTTDDQKLIVRFGKIGTKGQAQVKTFANSEEAVHEKDKLIEEKLLKGYKKC